MECERLAIAFSRSTRQPHQASPGAVYYDQWSDEDDFVNPVAASLGEVVTRWTDAIDAGVWRYDRSAERWVDDEHVRPDGTYDVVLGAAR